MNPIAMAEAAIGTVTGASWWRLALKLAPWVAIALLTMGLQATRGTLARVRLEHTAQLATMRTEASEAKAADEKRVADALGRYSVRSSAKQVITTRAANEVRDYAETIPGRAGCLGADRARGVQRDRAAFFPTDTATPAAGGDDSVSADSVADTTRRVDVQR